MRQNELPPELRQVNVWDAEAARTYDTPGEGMFAGDILGPTVERLAALADGGPALELAVGTGRVALPLAARGVPVTGIELSPAMVGRLREKADAATLPVVLGDMATATAPGAGSFALVYLVFNTISNHTTQDGQVECFRNAARHLRPGGAFVVELWVPSCGRCRSRRRPWSSTTSRATSASTPTTSWSRSSSRTTSASGPGATRRSAGARCATSGRPSWTSWRGSPG